MTVAGAHGKFSSSLATSTPRRSFAPGLNLFSPDDNFDMDRKENSLFMLEEEQPNRSTDMLAPSNDGNYVSSLQKRLSLVCLIKKN